MPNPDDLVNDELQAQMSGTKDRAHGWIGSKFVGIPAATASKKKPGSLPAPAPAGPRPVGSQGKKAGEWIGSKYVGPAPGNTVYDPITNPSGQTLPPGAPMNRAPAVPGVQNFSAQGAGSAPPSNAPAPPPVATPRAPTEPPFRQAPGHPPGVSVEAVEKAERDRLAREGGRGAASTTPPATTQPPLTREQYDALTPAQRTDYFAGKINADGTPKAATTPPATTPPATTPPAGMTAPKNRPVRGAPKIGDPTQSSHKYVGLRHLQAGGTIDSMLQLPEFAGWTKVGSDKVKNPLTGAVIDVTFDDESELQWSRVGGTGTAEDIAKGRAAAAARAGAAGGTGAAGAAGGVGGAGGAGGEGGTGGFGAGGAGGQGGGYPFPNDPALDAAIARLLSRGEAPVTRDSIADQYDPLAAQSQRAAGEARAAAAERAAFEGTNVGGAGGAFDASVNSINERAGQAQSALMANLITGELTQRRADVVNAIGFAQGEQKMRLQAQLAALDRELERQRLAQQNQQYYDDLGFQIGDREMYWNDRESDRL